MLLVEISGSRNRHYYISLAGENNGLFWGDVFLDGKELTKEQIVQLRAVHYNHKIICLTQPLENITLRDNAKKFHFQMSSVFTNSAN